MDAGGCGWMRVGGKWLKMRGGEGGASTSHGIRDPLYPVVSRFCVTKVPTVSRIFSLTDLIKYATLPSLMSPLGTVEVCRLVGIHRATLERWLSSGRLHPPQPIKIGGRVFRYWTQRDVDRVRRFKVKFYRKGRGRKPKPTTE